MAANGGVRTVTRPVVCQTSHVLNRTSDSTSTGGM